jgi:hypothetical protein
MTIFSRPQGICVDDLPDLDALADQDLAQRGLMDVTAGPFHADPTGQTDSTGAIQAAVTFGRRHKLAVFFPLGTYRISAPVACVGGWTEQHTALRRYLPHCEYWPCVLIGERRNGSRPRIVLADRSRGFADPEHPKPMLDFFAYNWSRPRHGDAPHPGRQGNVNFGQTLLGIDLEVGPGNPGAACVSFDAAEGSSLQDCRFDVGPGQAGVLGGPGCGALIANVEIIGGEYGCIVDSGRPPGTYVGCSFENQRRCAVRKSDRANLTLVGCTFKLPRRAHAVRSYPSGRSSLSLVDCRIAFEPGDAPATAILADSALYVRNVFVRDADRLVEAVQHPPVEGGPGWRHIRQAALPYRYEAPTTAPVYLDGRREDQSFVDVVDASPPSDLTSRHVWDQSDGPYWNDPRAVDVCRDYGAVGDGEHDDTAALQSAIDASQVVFLPKGAYRVSRTLRLRAETCLIGVHAAYSIIAPLPEGDFADPADPRPVLQTVDAADACTRLAFFGVYMPREIAPGARFIDWACGGKSWMRCVFPSTGFVRPDYQPLRAGIMPWDNWRWHQIHCAVDQHAFHYTTPQTDELIDHEPEPDWPMACVHGHGGGGWYPFVANEGRRHGPGHRRIRVSGIDGPFRIYNAVLQFGRGDCELEIAASRDVAMYGIKNEKESTVAWIHDSDGVLITGYSGTGQHNPRQKFLIENSSDVAIANSIDDCYAAGAVNPITGSSHTHDRPHIRERHGQEEIVTEPYERPVLYQRSPDTRPGRPA